MPIHSKKAVFRIRIGSVFNQVNVSASGSRRAKITHTNRIFFINFMFFKCWMFSFEGLFCSLDVLYGGLGIGKKVTNLRLMDPDPDPGGLKTCGTGGSGSGSATLLVPVPTSGS
jgi:hypothetical protein